MIKKILYKLKKGMLSLSTLGTKDTLSVLTFVAWHKLFVRAFASFYSVIKEMGVYANLFTLCGKRVTINIFSLLVFKILNIILGILSVIFLRTYFIKPFGALLDLLPCLFFASFSPLHGLLRKNNVILFFNFPSLSPPDCPYLYKLKALIGGNLTPSVQIANL